MRRLPVLASRAVAPLCALVVPVLLAGCASASGGAPTNAPDGSGLVRTPVQVGGGMIDVVRDTRASGHDVGAAPDAAWAALPAAFAEVGLTGGGPAVGRERAFSVVAPRLRGRIGKEPMSRFLSCGTTASGGPAADSHFIQLTIVTRVVPVASARSRLETQITARGTPIDGAQQPVDCSSTGVLELRIAQTVNRLLG